MRAIGQPLRQRFDLLVASPEGLPAGELIDAVEFRAPFHRGSVLQVGSKRFAR